MVGFGMVFTCCNCTTKEGLFYGGVMPRRSGEFEIGEVGDAKDVFARNLHAGDFNTGDSGSRLRAAA